MDYKTSQFYTQSVFSFLRRRKILSKAARETFLFKMTACSYNIYSDGFIPNGLSGLCGSPLSILKIKKQSKILNGSSDSSNKST